MTLDAGIICGKCDWLNPLTNSLCEDCGNDLSLQSGVRTEDPTIKTEGAPKFEESPPEAAQKGADEKPMEQARHYICKSCYSPVPSGHKFCGKCGTPVEAGAVGQEPNFFSDMQCPGKAKLILIKGEGMDGISYHLNSIEHLAGRTEGAILFTEDRWLSPKHATFLYDDNALKVRDEGSVNGVFISVKKSVDIKSGTWFMAGEQVFRVEEVAPLGDAPAEDGTYFYASPSRETSFRVVQILNGGGDGMVVHARDNQVVIGREGCDMNFPNDPYISGSHLKVEISKGKFKLSDLGSKNGTYVSIEKEYQLAHGDYVFLGRQLLRVEITN